MIPRELLRELSSVLRPTRLGSIHWAAKKALQARGYRWELRRKGELKLGVFRKKFRKTKAGGIPRRLVVLPGFGDSPLSWIPVFGLAQAAVRRRFDEVLYVDFPGFSGFLAGHRSYHSMDLLMESVFDFLDSEKPHTVFGHSLGGWLSALYASECGRGGRPLNPSGKKSPYSGPERTMLVVPGGLCKNSIEAFLEEPGHAWRSRVFHREPLWFRWVASDARKFLLREDIKQFLKSVKQEHYLEERVSHIRSRVDLLWTEHDALLPLSAAEYWLKKLPDQGKGQAVLLRGVGHSPHLENPVAIASVIYRMISGKKPIALGKRWFTALQVNSSR